MWKVYLLEFIIVLFVSVVWVYLIDKNMKDNDDTQFP